MVVRLTDVVSDFNDAVARGAPVSLHNAKGEHEDVIPFVPQSLLGNIKGQYYAVSDPGQLVVLDVARWTRLSKIPRVDNVRLIDPTGVSQTVAPRNLHGWSLEFDVRGIAKGDVYRVEVFPDPTGPSFTMVEQIPAGTHTSVVQHFKVPLTREARAEVSIAIYRVDAATARRDANESRPQEWGEYFEVR
jgi:hypothetical protein